MPYLKKIAPACFFLICCYCVQAQSSLATAQLKSLRGAVVSFASVAPRDTLVLVCLWSTNSDVSIDELNAINKKYEKGKASAPFRLLAISVDEGKSANRVKATANMNDWKFDVLTDINGDLKNALNAGNPPQSMIIRNQKVIYQQAGYEAGTEDYLLEKIRSLASGHQ